MNQVFSQTNEEVSFSSQNADLSFNGQFNYNDSCDTDESSRPESDSDGEDQSVDNGYETSSTTKQDKRSQRSTPRENKKQERRP